MLAEQATDVARQAQNVVAVASASQTLGEIARREGDLRGALDEYARAVELLRTTKMRARLQDALVKLAEVVSETGDLARANRLYAEALAARRR